MGLRAVACVTLCVALGGCVAERGGPVSPNVRDLCREWREPLPPFVTDVIGGGHGPVSSSLAMTATGRALIAAEDHDAVWLVDVDELNDGSARILATVDVGDAPSHVIVEGPVAYVTTRGGGTLEVIDLEEMRLVRSIPVGVEPRGLTRLPGARGIAVALAGEGAVAFVDPDSGVVTRHETAAGAEPWSVAVLGERFVVVGQRTRGVSVLDLQLGESRRGSLRPGSNASVDFPGEYSSEAIAVATMTPLGDTLVIPHGLTDRRRRVLAPNDGSAPCPGYYGGCGSGPGAVESALSWATIATWEDDSSLDRVSTSAYLRPRAARAVDTTAAAVIGFGKLRTLVIALERGRSVASISCFVGREPSVPIGEVPVGAGAEGIVPRIGAEGALVWSRFTRTLSLITFPDDRPHVVTSAALAEDALPVAASRGRALFHDATLSAEENVSCASCHPDGRDDGLNWWLPTGRKNTPPLGGGIGDTAPFHWEGEIADAAALEAMTVQTLMGGGGLRAEQVDDLMAYVDQLQPAPAAPRDPALVARGKALFESRALGCTSCHVGDDRTDNQNHVIRRPWGSAASSLQTPHLYGLSRSAPYLHQGEAETLEELVESYVRTDLMGTGSHLDDNEAAALVTYLKSL